MLAGEGWERGGARSEMGLGFECASGGVGGGSGVCDCECPKDEWTCDMLLSFTGA